MKNFVQKRYEMLTDDVTVRNGDRNVSTRTISCFLNTN